VNARADLRLPAIVAAALAIGFLGMLVRTLSEPVPNRTASEFSDQTPAKVTTKYHAPGDEVAQHFRQGVMMLHAKQYDVAVTAMRRVLDIVPDLPEAHVNLGFAEFELGLNDAAVGHFNAAIRLRARQANAYYGLAVALERRCDSWGAISAMRTFIHLAESQDPFIRKAEAALWEWGAADAGAAAGCAGGTTAASQPE